MGWIRSTAAPSGQIILPQRAGQGLEDVCVRSMRNITLCSALLQHNFTFQTIIFYYVTIENINFKSA